VVPVSGHSTIGTEQSKVNKQPTRIRTALNALAGVTLALGICAAASARANDGAFTVSSLQGRYAYVNNTEGVASFGPMSFDGRGGVTLSETINLPCANPGQTCDRTIADVKATGTYTVNSDGTGVATFAFRFADGTPIGTEEYDFVITAATRRLEKLLATQVFAADRSGGLAGQLVAPTWSRVSD
jgi:hypothetical protein